VPLFGGKPPSALFEDNVPGLRVVRNCQHLPYMQLVTRIAPIDSKDNYARLWWPQVETNMSFIKIAD